MTTALADPSLVEMYGEKIDASESEDFYPFVAIGLNSPNFLFSDKKEHSEQ